MIFPQGPGARGKTTTLSAWRRLPAAAGDPRQSPGRIPLTTSSWANEIELPISEPFGAARPAPSRDMESSFFRCRGLKWQNHDPTSGAGTPQVTCLPRGADGLGGRLRRGRSRCTTPPGPGGSSSRERGCGGGPEAGVGPEEERKDAHSAPGMIRVAIREHESWCWAYLDCGSCILRRRLTTCPASLVLGEEHSDYRYFPLGELSEVHRVRVRDCLEFDGFVRSRKF